MTVRVTLVTPAAGAELRDTAFGADGPLDDAGRLAAQRASLPLGAEVPAYASASARCRETAAALGLTAEPAPALADWDVGRWRGRRLDELAAAEPEDVARWLAEPDAAPHGGESLLELRDRVGGWLDGLTGRTAAVAEPAAVRAAVVHALVLPPETFWRLDVPPLTATELSGRAGRWNLRCGRPLAVTPRRGTSG